MDNRAVSAVLGYVMTLGIVTLLISGLLFSAGNYVESQHDRAIRAEFEVVGNRVAADIAAVDRLALAAEGTGEASLQVELPPLAAGKPYRFATEPVTGSSSVYRITVSTSTPPHVTVETLVKTKTPLVNSTANGGDVFVAYNGTHLEVQDA